MELPTYYKIKIDKNTSESIDQVLGVSPIGQRPCYLDLGDKKSTEVISLLNIIYERICHLGINHRLPYPIYVITEYLENHDHFQVIKGLTDLPKFFGLQNKRPKNRDIELLRKINIQKKRISNLKIKNKLNFIKNNINSDKKLFLLSTEYQHLKTIEQGLLNREKGKYLNE